MKHAVLVFLTLIVFNITAIAQWKASNSQIDGYAVSYPAANAAYITAGTGLLYKSQDGGETWSQIHDFGPFSNLGDPNFINADTGFVSANGGVARTFDGALTWQFITATWGQLTGYPYSDIKLTGNRLYASFVSNDTAYIVQSDDYGTSVSSVFSQYQPNAQPFLFSFVDTQNGFLVNPLELEEVLKTTDGGQTFDTIFITTGPIVLQSEFDFTDLQNGYFYGSYGSQSHPTRTWNTGTFYFPIDLDGFGVLPVHDLDFNTSKLYAASLYGKIFYSANNGQNWTEQSTPVNDLISSIAFLNETDGIAVSYGKVLYTFNGGMLGRGEEALDELRVFPNPANEQVKIQVPNRAPLNEISLWDVAGRKLKTYDSTDRVLDVSKLPSGQYILRLSFKSGEVSHCLILE